MIGFCRAAGVAAAASCFLPVWSSAAAGATDEAVPLDEVQVTATRDERTVYDVGSAVTVVGPEEIERATPQVLPDLLRGQPGVFVQQTTPGQATPIVRGLKGSEVLALVDGMRLNNAIFRNAPNQYLALVDLLNVERLEVVRGPLPSLYGSDAMGGVVQVITPVPHFAGEAWSWRGHALTRFASAADAQLHHLDLDAGTRAIAISGGLTWENVHDRRAGGGEPLRPSGYTARAANAKLVLTPDPAREWLFDVQFYEQPDTPRYDELVPGFGQTEPASATFDFEPNARLFLHGRYRVAEPVGFTDSLELHVGWQVIDDDRRNRNLGEVIETRERNASELLGLTLQASSDAGERHVLTYGAELYLDEVSSRRSARDVETGVVDATDSRFPDGSSMDSVALYLSDRLRLTDRLLVTLGARFSHFAIDLAPADGSAGARLSIDDLTGDLSVVYRAAERLSLVANLGRGFRPPNIFDLGTLGPRPGNRFNIANPNLEPESVISADLGLRAHGAGFTAEAFIFASDFRDKIDSSLTGGMTSDGRDIVQNRNLNEVRLHGAELAARWLLFDAWELSGNLLYVRGEEGFPDGSEQPADRVPPLSGRLGALYEPHPQGWLEVWLRLAGEQDRLSDRDRTDPRIDPAGTPGWATLNAGFGWHLNDALSLSLELANLTDRRYREHASGIDAPGFDATLTLQARW